MDPKLRPSFSDLVRHLEEIFARLKVEDMEHECVPLTGDNDKKTIAKGNSPPLPPSHKTSALQSIKATSFYLHEDGCKFLQGEVKGGETVSKQGNRNFPHLALATYNREVLSSQPVNYFIIYPMSNPTLLFPPNTTVLLILKQTVTYKRCCLHCPHPKHTARLAQARFCSFQTAV